MSDQTILTIVAAIPGIIAAIGALMALRRSSEVKQEVNKVHTLVNSKFSEQLEKTERALEELARFMPTARNLAAADAAKEIVSEHHAAIKATVTEAIEKEEAKKSSMA